REQKAHLFHRRSSRMLRVMHYWLPQESRLSQICGGCWIESSSVELRRMILVMLIVCESYECLIGQYCRELNPVAVVEQAG
ncbi:MAG: hypothetical protein ACI957_003281, partial [Verrucomicrobiales bacterium]